MDFPRFVFRAGGSLIVNGGTVSQSLVDDDAQRKLLLSDGWHDTVADALSSGADAENPEQQDDDAPPTRDEMLEQAAALGITVDKRWSDKTLLAKIAGAM